MRSESGGQWRAGVVGYLRSPAVVGGKGCGEVAVHTLLEPNLCPLISLLPLSLSSWACNYILHIALDQSVSILCLKFYFSLSLSLFLSVGRFCWVV